MNALFSLFHRIRKEINDDIPLPGIRYLTDFCRLERNKNFARRVTTALNIENEYSLALEE